MIILDAKKTAEPRKDRKFTKANSIPALAMTRKEVQHQLPKLQPGECHLWHISLEESEENLARQTQHLSSEERKRASDFLLPAPRLQFIVTRSALRLLLGSYLGIPPETLQFTLNPYGKPSLHSPLANFRFNVSHSGKLALIAISMEVDVGVDIEQHRTLDDGAGLAKMIWCQEDLDLWLGLSPDARLNAFYQAWTRKEAIAKALGYGLTLDFKNLRVSFAPKAQAELINIEPSLGVAREWTLIDINAGDAYSAALATITPKIKLMQYRFPSQYPYQPHTIT